jgi:predicted PurR-regulated permease PerM
MSAEPIDIVASEFPGVAPPSSAAPPAPAWGFHAVFVAITLVLLAVLWPFATVTLFAAVTASVAYPLYLRLLRWVRRPALASVLTTTALGFGVLIPVTWVAVAWVQEAVSLGDRGLAFVRGGGLDRAVGWLHRTYVARLPPSLDGVAPEGNTAVESGLQSAATWALTWLTGSLPSWVASTASLAVNAAIFIVLLATLLVQGPRVLGVVRDLAPLPPSHVDRLFAVFSGLARRLVLGAIAVAVTQGLVATIGYGIVGVDGLVFWGISTAICALVPVVGSALVYLPLCALTWANRGPGWALFLLIWQLGLTSQVDSLVRPLVLGGEQHIHPVILLLAVLGGLAWLGPPGALVGPGAVVAFTAMLSIYRSEFLGRG